MPMVTESLPVLRWMRDLASRREQVSPELVLVDPALRRRLLEQETNEDLDPAASPAPGDSSDRAAALV